MNKKYESYKLIDYSKYIFKEDGIYSKKYNKKIKGYAIGNEKKYYQTRLACIDGKNRSLYIHVALWIYFNGEIPDGMEINHKDEDTTNNTLPNLNLLSHIDNMNWGTCQQKKAVSIMNSEKIKRRRQQRDGN